MSVAMEVLNQKLDFVQRQLREQRKVFEEARARLRASEVDLDKWIAWEEDLKAAIAVLEAKTNENGGAA